MSQPRTFMSSVVPAGPELLLCPVPLPRPAISAPSPMNESMLGSGDSSITRPAPAD
ncbi:uncharacterized protein BDV17DRAFT_277852 [Aspergillus undulatus]|uniref:uncharacterized protein n=1 Tax=Aspergillus undulatus TaxID=1810928 RepID=UPI003CCDBA2F